MGSSKAEAKDPRNDVVEAGRPHINLRCPSVQNSLLTTCTVDITGNGRIVSIIEDPALFLNDIQIFL